MTKLKLALLGALIGVSTASMAAVDTTTREQRMDQALQSYRGTPARDSGAGPAARTEESIKGGARRTGASIERGAKRAGNAVSNGARKTRDAVRRTGKKMGGSSTPENQNDAATNK